MRKLVILLLLALPALACGGNNLTDLVPTLAAEAGAPDGDEAGGDLAPGDSPRDNPAVSVPATWTPLPPPPLVTSAPLTYIVLPGDTLEEIAEAFDVDLEELAELNGIENVNVIEVGRVLTIPES